MAPTFSTPNKIVTVTGTVVNRAYLTEGDVRAALAELGRDYGVTVDGLTVTVTDGPRTVTLTQEEYDTLRQGGQA
jgi:hypothetical protein